jgi:hypothetical protein
MEYDFKFEIPENLNVEDIKKQQLDCVLIYPKTKKIIEEQNIPLDIVKRYIHFFVKVINDDISFKKDSSLNNKELNGLIAGIISDSIIFYKYDEKSNY